ncbi:MAG: hypothetical protein OXG24_05375 [Gammaproteobacteria bacterium]|nr:hypothetical protein [Gammaproteobacteria bacterium]
MCLPLRVLNVVASVRFPTVLGNLAVISVCLALSIQATANENIRTSNTSNDTESFSVAQTESRRTNDIKDSESSRDDQSTIRSLKDLEKYKSPLRRNLALHELVSAAEKKQVLELLEESNEIVPQRRRQIQQLILQRFAQLDPVKAYEQIQSLAAHDSRHLIDSIFKEWSAHSLEEAVEFAGSLEDEEKSFALWGILAERTDLSDEKRREVAHQLGDEGYAINLIIQEKLSKPIANPEKTWDEITREIEGGPGQAWMLATVARAWVDKSGLRVLDRISNSISNSQTRQMVLNSVLLREAEIDAEGAFAYALKYDDRPGNHNSLLSVVTNAWVKSDPQSAMDAASRVEKFGLRRSVEESVARAWANQNPRDVLSILDSLPDHLRNAATSTAISAMVNEDPVEASKFVAGMEGTLRATAASSLITVWSSRHKDYEGMLDWVLNEPGIADLRTFLLPVALSHVSYVDPKLAMDEALKLPMAPGQPGFEASIIRYLTHRDIDSAREFLPRVRAGITQTEAYGHVGNYYLQNGETDEVFNLALQLPDTNRAAYFQTLLHTWSQYDPGGLLDSIDKLPTPDSKSKAALALSVSNKGHRKLTKQQLETASRYLSQEDADSLENGEFRSRLGW